MDIDESIDLIYEAIEEYSDSRNYEIFVHCVDKEKFSTYYDYKKALAEENQKVIEVVDVEEIKAKNKQILKDFIKGR